MLTDQSEDKRGQSDDQIRLAFEKLSLKNINTSSILAVLIAIIVIMVTRAWCETDMPFQWFSSPRVCFPFGLE